MGVATPMKIVPSTRKIRNSGGIITKVTRSASAESIFRRNTLLAIAITNAVSPHSSRLTTTCSSTGAVSFSSHCPST
ncbi:Uncharacterised protein [Bordetella pertussis]|nr:Uncharacterised protein [Bordetella pertussis]